MEALLLWGIQQRTSAEMKTALDNIVGRKSNLKFSSSSPLDWGLANYLAVASELAIIDKDSFHVGQIAKDFRNLIHPGRAIREGVRCDRGTAMTTTGALELVMRDLLARFPCGESG
jgi:hypothetical protein